MSFVTLPFYVFAVSVALLYYMLPQRFQWLVLTLASVMFYATYGIEQFPFIILGTVIAYYSARWMQGIYDLPNEQSKQERKTEARKFLFVGAGGLIFLLVYAKTGTWMLQSLAGLLSRSMEGLEVAAVLGVSYYTFSLVSYLADVYWQKDRAESNFLRLFLFAIYFPKILQGPIARHKDLAPQLAEEHAFSYRELCFGLQLMLWGYFKKMVIADRLAIFVNTVFGNAESSSGSHLLVAACFGAVQIYCDFSGCMDIVAGFSQILGLKLTPNFNHPFFSRSAAEFWRRWHITLGTWFKDYVYMPLMISPKLIGVSKRFRQRFGVREGKAVMIVVPFFTVWMLIGLWHSIGWNYVVWCLYWCSIIICSTIFAPEMKKLTQALRINTEAGSWHIFQMVRTFILFLISRIITVPGDLNVSRKIFKNIFQCFHPENLMDGSLYSLGLDRPNFILAIVCIFILWAVSMLQERGSVRERIANSNIVFRWAIYYAAFFSIVIFGIYGPGYDPAAFVYMQF